ncbi:MAG TPA: hypothetical protein PLU80_10510, partial [Acidobacteriota bacterium]|nr:hypothetical protein [Acidobacteriota bacterium]
LFIFSPLSSARSLPPQAQCLQPEVFSPKPNVFSPSLGLTCLKGGRHNEAGNINIATTSYLRRTCSDSQSINLLNNLGLSPTDN